MAEWYTRTPKERVEQSVQVQLLSRALKVAWLSWLERLVYNTKYCPENRKIFGIEKDP